jgi:hypothetical protein
MVLLYPVYWILQEPKLFIIYLLSVITLFASVRRNECPRCIYTECPVRIPLHCDHSFRCKLTTDSAGL